jgi:hypothetical protein
VAKADWLIIRVELVGWSGDVVAPSPGRDLLVSSRHSLYRLAVAIDSAFARWDLGHLHMFRFPHDIEYMLGGDEDDPGLANTESILIETLRLEEGAEFEYIFDLGDEWLHRCEVRAVGVDPEAEFEDVPLGPVPILGWGDIPDQYGRTTPDQ